MRFRQHTGGDRFVGRKLRALLREAGFKNTRASASCMTWGTPEEIKAYAAMCIDNLNRTLREVALRLGWASATDLEDLEQAYGRAVAQALR